MNELERIKYLQGLADNGLISEFNNDDIIFLLGIAGQLEQVAIEFNPMLNEGHMNEYANAFEAWSNINSEFGCKL
ncbi:hypothetical protein [Lysinibacillus sp. BPa_S21]|uniref:hypothetical protein n=1 Tax=Lysinibacillus sp. BPa_S21 TaxID=2932478 RepID=UPI0020125AC7|nr:hypothetical protein [Lysinibacillus sp. BPa_S21]MCL1696324.1 hypothetical protein [Lysinibacillus sp. BPa_S21]